MNDERKLLLATAALAVGRAPMGVLTPQEKEFLAQFLGAQTLIAEGNVTSASSTQLAVGVVNSTPGTLFATNTGASAVYLAGGGRTASSSSFLLAAGASNASLNLTVSEGVAESAA